MIAFWEDVAIGDRDILGTHTFSRDEIVEFAREWDPQAFHLDEAAAQTSIFGGLCASGWHTGCVAMRLVVEARDAFRAARERAGEPLPPLGVSPGFSNMRWPVPTRPGDTLTYSAEVLGKRETKRPQWGLVHVRTSAHNQRGEEAISFESMVFVARNRGRPSGAMVGDDALS